MPRRAATRPSTVASSSAPTSPAPPPSDSTYLSNLSTLRRCWKWAAFSQFFFTFSPLFALNDVSISDIEEDLTRSARLYLPRVIQKLLFALTQDRKISLDNWQSALRKQYARRDLEANPIGFEPKKSNLKYSFEPVEIKEELTAPPTDAPATDPSVPSSSTAEPDRQNQSLPHAPSDDGDDFPGANSEYEHDPAKAEEDQDELKDWLELPMLAKLDSLHLLTEWQFHNPNRIRSIMKDDDETAQWRIAPIGYDSKSNAYWFIGAASLWLQRNLKPKTLKRKRPPAVSSRKSKAAGVKGRRSKTTAKRRKIADDSSESGSLVADPQMTAAANGTATRAAKTKANKKLDAQAKALAEFQRQNMYMTKSGRATKRQKLDEEADFSTPRRTFGTRMSSRLRSSANDEDEWQQIPDDWLDGDMQASQPESIVHTTNRIGRDAGSDDAKPAKSTKISKVKTGLESDIESISDLTELSTNSSKTEDGQADNNDDEPDDDDEDDSDDGARKEDELEVIGEEEEEEQRSSQLNEELVEWEMICSTLEEWEHIAERFKGATHYAERALYKLLSNHIVPAVIEDLCEKEKAKQEAERKKYVEEAVVHRKRSSRIAIKESEKEEARLAAQRQTEEVEKMSRAKRLEMRQKREEAERQKKEQALEQKLLEREEREQKAKKKSGVTNGSIDTSRETSTSSTRMASGSQINGDWELDCEVCHRRGINQDDDVPLMSCGSCSKWQHIPCHDEANRISGRSPRNWEAEEFFCSACRPRTGVSMPPQLSDQTHSPHGYPQAKVQLRWEHGRSLPKLPISHHIVDPRVLPESAAVNGYPQSVNVRAFQRVSPPPPASNPYANISFSHYQPQQRGFSSAPGRPAITQYGSVVASPQIRAYDSTPEYRLPANPATTAMPTAQNGSWDTSQRYANEPNFPSVPAYGMPLQDPQPYQHQQQALPATSLQQWGYGPTAQTSRTEPPSHLNQPGASASTDYGI